MAETIQSLFPVTEHPGKQFTVYPCIAEFSAGVERGKYIFDNRKTPPVKFGRLLQGQTGVIAGVLISANCSDSDFTKSLTKPLSLQVIHGGNRTPVNMAPFYFTSFANGSNFQLQWEITAASVKQDDDFLLGVVGEVDQINEMTDDNLILKIAFNFIRFDGQGL